MDSPMLQGLIEDLPDEERPRTPFEDFELTPRKAPEDSKEPELPARFSPPADWTDQQIRGWLEGLGHDSNYVDSYLLGWHKKPFKK